MSETDLPFPTTPRLREAQAAADALTSTFSAPPIPVKEIAEQSGVEVVFTSFGESSDRVAGFCDFDARRLYVNETDILTRQMFTMAHELGHWILHRDYFDDFPSSYNVLPRYSRPRENPLEREANIFAANLLAPSRLLRPVRDAGVARLADLFGVSRQMMELRLREI